MSDNKTAGPPVSPQAGSAKTVTRWSHVQAAHCFGALNAAVAADETQWVNGSEYACKVAIAGLQMPIDTEAFGSDTVTLATNDCNWVASGMGSQLTNYLHTTSDYSAAEKQNIAARLGTRRAAEGAGQPHVGKSKERNHYRARTRLLPRLGKQRIAARRRQHRQCKHLGTTQQQSDRPRIASAKIAQPRRTRSSMTQLQECATCLKTQAKGC